MEKETKREKNINVTPNAFSVNKKQLFVSAGKKTREKHAISAFHLWFDDIYFY